MGTSIERHGDEIDEESFSESEDGPYDYASLSDADISSESEVEPGQVMINGMCKLRFRFILTIYCWFRI